ncbi:putative gustatory receptor 2a [Hermetia illucens]|uniref:putative gustatory receptor 2a n=1 Tax=Hermetia illucens TaxID=343691 RepID=UPI0018CC0656|nr:putative gustatory receptor 2a [Hermetia illucens]
MSEFLSTIRVFHNIFKFIGISPVDISKSSRGTSFAFAGYSLMIVLITSLLLYGSVVITTSIYTESQYIAKLLDNTNLWAILSMHIYVQFESWRKHNVLVDMTKQFDEIDHQLVKNFQVKFDRALLRRNILPFGLIYSYTFSSVLCLTTLHIYWDCCWIYWLFTFLAEFVVRWKYIQICIYVTSIDERVKILAKEGRKYLKELELTRFDSRREREKVLDKIFYFKDIYTRFWWICDSFNDCFGYTIVVLYLTSFLNLISRTFWFYIGTHANLDYPENLLVSIESVLYPPPILLQLFIIMKDNSERRNERTKQIWHSIPNSRFDPYLNHAIRELSLQLLHENLIFTGAGFFELNFKALGGLILAATIYLVILLQFQTES